PARRVRGRPTRSVPPLSSVCKPRRRSCRSLNDELRASKLGAVGTQHDGRPLTSRGDAFGLSPGAPASLIGRHFKINKTDLRTAFVFEHHTHLIRLIAFVRQLEKGVHRFGGPDLLGHYRFTIDDARRDTQSLYNRRCCPGRTSVTRSALHSLVDSRTAWGLGLRGIG